MFELIVKQIVFQQETSKTCKKTRLIAYDSKIICLNSISYERAK